MGRGSATRVMRGGVGGWGCDEGQREAVWGVPRAIENASPIPTPRRPIPTPQAKSFLFKEQPSMLPAEMEARDSYRSVIPTPSP